MKRLTLLTLLFALITGAQACSIPSEQSNWSKNRIVDGTATVVLARFTKAIPREARFTYHFQVLKILKGKVTSQRLVLELAPAPSNYVEETFQDHVAPEFWEGTYGRLPWLNGFRVRSGKVPEYPTLARCPT